MEILLALLGGSLIGNILGLFALRRKHSSDADLNVVNAASQVVKLYGQAITDLRSKEAGLEQQLRTLREEIRALKQEVEDLKKENIALNYQLSGNKW